MQSMGLFFKHSAPLMPFWHSHRQEKIMKEITGVLLNDARKISGFLLNNANEIAGFLLNDAYKIGGFLLSLTHEIHGCLLSHGQDNHREENDTNEVTGFLQSDAAKISHFLLNFTHGIHGHPLDDASEIIGLRLNDLDEIHGMVRNEMGEISGGAPVTGGMLKAAPIDGAMSPGVVVRMLFGGILQNLISQTHTHARDGPDSCNGKRLFVGGTSIPTLLSIAELKASSRCFTGTYRRSSTTLRTANSRNLAT